MTLTVEQWRLALSPPPDRVEVFREALNATHLPWSLDRPVAAPSLPDEGLTRYRIGDVALVDCRCGPCGGQRGRPELAATDEDAVGVLFVRSGKEEVEAGGERLLLRPGAALLWHSDEQLRFRVPGRLHKWSLFVPRARLPAGGLTGGRMLDPTAVGLLTALLGTTIRSAESLDERVGMTVADAVVDLLAGAFQDPPRHSEDATWLRVSAYVHQHLHDPGLTPQAMAVASCVSLRSLYALFEAHGESPARYVRRRRLAGARSELLRRGTGVTVSEVARRWGFGDQTTFGRSFRAAYGQTPDEVRRGDGGPSR